MIKLSATPYQNTQAVEVVKSYIDNLISTLGGVKATIALAGIVLVTIIVLFYLGYGFYKFIKATLRLRPHEFALAMLALGLSLIVVAILIP